MCRLYGKADCDVFYGTWVPLMYVVATQGIIFNWTSILSSSLRTNIVAAQSPPLEQPPEFYMSSYLLDVVCSRCHFEHWSCNWDSSVSQLVHYHYKVFWDTAYRAALDIISKTFIIPLYQLLFGEEPPCMLKRPMRTVVKVAHWFPIDEGTIVSVFGTHKAPHALPSQIGLFYKRSATR